MDKLVMEGISRLTANCKPYEVMAIPFSGLLVEETDGQKCLDSPEVPAIWI